MTVNKEINITNIDCGDPTNLFQHIADLWNATAVKDYVLFYNLTEETKLIAFDWLDQLPSSFEYREFYQSYFMVKKVK